MTSSWTMGVAAMWSEHAGKYGTLEWVFRKDIVGEGWDCLVGGVMLFTWEAGIEP